MPVIGNCLNSLHGLGILNDISLGLTGHVDLNNNADIGIDATPPPQISYMGGLHNNLFTTACRCKCSEMTNTYNIIHYRYLACDCRRDINGSVSDSNACMVGS